ncbi:MAG TPA: DUF58 domain-containing protein [Solirubrobacteraceae bacterium]
MRPAAATALLGLLLTLTAATFDAEPLYVPGVGLVFLAAATTLWVALGARGVRVARTLGARRTLEEEPVHIDLVVSSGRMPLPRGLIEDELLSEPAVMAGGRRRTEVRINARFARRGRKLLPPPRIVVSDPFGLATRIVSAAEPAEVLVLPRLEPVVTPPGAGDSSGVAARRGRPSIAAEVDLDGLRPYRPGAAASRIFWQGLARGGDLMERRLRADGDTRPLVVLDPRRPAREEDLDMAVRAAASLCVHLARLGGCALLLPGDRRPTTLEPTLIGWPNLHVRLALIDGGSSRSPNVAGLAARRGPLLYVAACAPGRAPRALQHAVGGGRFLIVPGGDGIAGTMAQRPDRRGGRRAVFAVAGCTGYELTGGRQRIAEVA